MDTLRCRVKATFYVGKKGIITAKTQSLLAVAIHIGCPFKMELIKWYIG